MTPIPRFGKKVFSKENKLPSPHWQSMAARMLPTSNGWGLVKALWELEECLLPVPCIAPALPMLILQRHLASCHNHPLVVLLHRLARRLMRLHHFMIALVQQPLLPIHL